MWLQVPDIIELARMYWTILNIGISLENVAHN